MVYYKKFKQFRKKKGVYAGKVTRNIKKYVSRAISRNKETHKSEYQISEISVNSVDTAPKYLDGHMSIAQGDAYTGRSAHRIKGVGTSLKFMLHNNYTSPVFLRFVAIVNRSGKVDTDYQTGASLFEGNSGNINFASATNTQRLTARINTDKYKVLRDRVIKLGGTLDSTKLNVSKTWIPQRKFIWDYDGSSATLPQRNNVVFLWWIIEGAADESTGQVVELHACAQFYFKDL